MRRKLRDARPKAFWGLVASGLGTVANMFLDNQRSKTQREQFEEQKQLQLDDLKRQGMMNDITSINNYFANDKPVERAYMFKRGGSIGKRGRKFSIKNGKLIPVDDSLSYIVGPSHSTGGVPIDDGRAKFEAEGGEALERRPNEDVVYSNSEDMRTPLLEGETPAEYVTSRPYDNVAKQYAQEVQEGMKRTLRNASPVGKNGRPMADLGDRYNRWGYRNKDWRNGILNWFNDESPSGNVTNAGWNSGMQYRDYPSINVTERLAYSPKLKFGIQSNPADTQSPLNPINMARPLKVLTNNRQDLADWFGGDVKPLDWALLGVNTILPFFAYRNSNSNFEKQKELMANWQKELNGLKTGLATPSYISQNTDIDDTATRRELRNSYYTAGLLNRRNTASANNMLDKHNTMFNAYQTELSKAMQDTANKELELRNTDIGVRNQFNMAAMNANADWRRALLSANLDLHKMESGMYDSHFDSNEGLINALMQGAGIFAQSVHDRQQERRNLELALATGRPETIDYLRNRVPWIRRSLRYYSPLT